MGIMLAVQNVTLFLITISTLPLYAIVILGFTKSFNHLNNDQMESNAIVSSSIIEDIQGIETIKALNSGQTRYRRIDNQFVDFLRKSFKYSKTKALQDALKSFIQMSLNIVILWVGSWIVMHNRMTIGELMTYNALLAYFVSPLQNVINLQPLLQSANVAQNRLNEVYLVKSEFNNEKNKVKKVEQIKGDIIFQNVNFKYSFGKDILHNINLKVSKREKLAIVGMSGSGKSTLVKLLVSFFSPNEGTITINGIPTTAIDKRTLRSYITYVPQTPYTFSGSIRDNLLLGSSPDTTEADIIKACQLAEIDKEIDKLPLKFDTELDENAKILSGGQKQRITIARALLSPSSVLIFDESTSGLDSITEKNVVKNLMSLDDKTIIFIAHRLSIAKRANDIVVLNDGKIVEEGSHSDSMTKKGYYYDLVNS